MEAARRLYHEGMGKIRFRPMLNRTQRQISELNRQMRKITTARHLTPAEKRSRIDRLTERKNTLTERVYQRYMEARS
jgi:hypothetical protein